MKRLLFGLICWCAMLAPSSAAELESIIENGADPLVLDIVESGLYRGHWGRGLLSHDNPVDYLANDFVIYNGELYVCILQHTDLGGPPPIADTEAWHYVPLHHNKRFTQDYLTGNGESLVGREAYTGEIWETSGTGHLNTAVYDYLTSSDNTYYILPGLGGVYSWGVTASSTAANLLFTLAIGGDSTDPMVKIIGGTVTQMLHINFAATKTQFYYWEADPNGDGDYSDKVVAASFIPSIYQYRGLYAISSGEVLNLAVHLRGDALIASINGIITSIYIDPRIDRIGEVADEAYTQNHDAVEGVERVYSIAGYVD